MPDPATPTPRFDYRAVSAQGRPVTGSIDAPDAAAARTELTALGLEVRQLAPDADQKRLRPLDAQNFAAFNEQLAALTAAGLPVESGLRLVAAEMRHGRLADAARAVADDLERGQTLGQAFAQHRDAFPPLYGQLVDAGVHAGNLPGLLYNLGRHLDLLARLRAAVWQAAAYPLMVTLALALILLLLSWFIFPQFIEMYDDFGTDLPALTELIINSSTWLPWAMFVLIALILAAPLVWGVARVLRWDVPLADGFAMVLPLLGGVLRRNLLARWLDTVRLAVEAGLDLPSAFALASDALGSPSIQRDTAKLHDTLTAGRPLTQTTGLRLIPPSAATAIQLAAEQGRLPETLGTLTELYRRQAEQHVAGVQVMLAPIMLVVLGLVISLVVIALFLPLVRLMSSLM